MQIAQLKEATRIGRRVLLLCIEPTVGADENGSERDLLEFALAPLVSLRTAAESAEVQLNALHVKTPRLGAYRVEAV